MTNGLISLLVFLQVNETTARRSPSRKGKIVGATRLLVGTKYDSKGEESTKLDDPPMVLYPT
jgi:hypothetical protein